MGPGSNLCPHDAVPSNFASPTLSAAAGLGEATAITVKSEYTSVTANLIAFDGSTIVYLFGRSMKRRPDCCVENDRLSDERHLLPSASRIMRGLGLFREPVESGPRSSRDQCEMLQPALRAEPSIEADHWDSAITAPIR
jgi:hypothetical protein